jgi:cystatin-A/B
MINELKTEIEGRVGASFSVFKATTYTSQVVAGTNYLVNIEVDGEKTIRVKVFRPLPHTNLGPKVTEAGFV